MDIIETLRTFVRVVETGSLAAVAREMNASQSTMSRQITQLEEHFGVRLLHRTTRRLSLTDDGQGLHDHARDMLEMVDGMEETLGQRKSSPTGHVRVGTPVSLGLLLVARLPLLTARFPGLSVELVMEDQAGDMIGERLDLAVRSGEVSNPSLIQTGVGSVVRVAVASPDYLDRRGAPVRHEDLTEHDCVVHLVAESDARWRLIGPDGLVDFAVRGTVSTNNHAAVRAAALGGLGIALIPEYQAVDDILAGRLRRVLPDHASESLPAFVVYPSRRHLAPRTRVVLDFLVAEVRALRSRRIDREERMIVHADPYRNTRVLPDHAAWCIDTSTTPVGVDF